MRNYLLIAMLIGCLPFNGKGQNKTEIINSFTIVKLPGFYKEDGIIFNEGYSIGIEIKKGKSRYTPTLSDVEKVEEVFNARYNQLQGTTINVKQFFFHWVRQYFGLIDSNGKKNIIVQLINNNKPSKINRLLGKGWKRNFVVMLSDSFYAVSNRFRINIETGEMSTEL